MTIPVPTPRGVARRWVAAFNAADVDALAALYHDDATDHQVARESVHGRDAIRARYAADFADAATECVPVNLFEDGEWAILEWKDPNGLLGCELFEVIDGRVKLRRSYWDRLNAVHAPASVEA